MKSPPSVLPSFDPNTNKGARGGRGQDRVAAGLKPDPADPAAPRKILESFPASGGTAIRGIFPLRPKPPPQQRFHEGNLAGAAFITPWQAALFPCISKPSKVACPVPSC